MFLSCVVRTTTQAILAVSGWGSGTKDGEGWYPYAFKRKGRGSSGKSAPTVIKPRDDWQHVAWRGEIAELQDYDFATEGFSLSVTTETESQDLRIDSMEFCAQAEPGRKAQGRKTRE